MQSMQGGIMYNTNHMNKYQAYANAAMTVGKTRQVVMLYDGVIRFVKQSVEAIEQQDYETRFNLLTKSAAIIGGLQSSLDFEHGGDIAKLLYDYYASIDARLFSVHRSNDTAVLQGVIKELKMMRDVWSEIDGADSEKKATAAAEDSAPLPRTPDVQYSGIGVSA